MRPHILLPSALLCSLLLGFGIGILHEKHQHHSTETHPLSTFREISIVQLQAIEGDSLKTLISGPARILWNEDMVEKDGTYHIPLGQIETENDREFRLYPYVGNAKTNNFYPADSYPARGTEPRYRRFFESKEAALQAGFNASKLVK